MSSSGYNHNSDFPNDIDDTTSQFKLRMTILKIFGIAILSIFLLIGCILISSVLYLALHNLYTRYRRRIQQHTNDTRLVEILTIKENIEIDDIPCIICLDDLEDNIIELRCKHYYHQKCIKEWIDVKPVCPLCYRNVLT